jgi:circadian clock protein KaiC
LATDEIFKGSDMARSLKNPSPASNPRQLQKCPTGIKGFDEITEGGLPMNRITLISGGPGSGKTLLGIDFLVNGVIHYKEPGVFMSFEETEDEIYQDLSSLNLDLQGLVSKNEIRFEHTSVR